MHALTFEPSPTEDRLKEATKAGVTKDWTPCYKQVFSQREYVANGSLNLSFQHPPYI